MANTLKYRFPLLLLLGTIFLASVCVSYGIEQHEQRSPREWRPRPESEEDERQHGHPGKWRPSRGEREDEEEDEGQRRHPHRQREDEDEPRPRFERTRGRSEEDDEKEERERHGRREDPEERERREKRQRQRRERSRRGEREEEEEEGSSSSESESRRNPFLFSANKFETLFENENGEIRVLQRFDKRSNLFKNLQNYRLVEYRAKPNTLILPQHNDADFILVVLSGKALLTVLNQDDRNSYNLECGDTIRLPAGTIAYLANPDNDEELRVVDLAIPVNRPGQFQSFFPAGNQQSYFNGFSRNILEASFNTNYENIEKVLLQEQEDEAPQRRGRRGRQQSQNAEPIVKISRDQIEELKRNAKSSSNKSSKKTSKKSKSSQSESEPEPFNLRNSDPIYSNKFGKFFEVTPEKNPQLQDLDIFVSSVEINEGALLLPHYNSRATVVLVVNEGKGNLELVGQRNEQQEQREDEDEQQEQEQEQDENRQVQRYRARLSRGDVVVIPAGHPVAVNANSNLNFIGFGINAENNQRNFLAGEDDNVISQIERPVKEVAFPGSAEEVERLIKNQKESHFANAEPQQREEGKQRGRGPLSSILGAFY